MKARIFFPETKGVGAPKVGAVTQKGGAGAPHPFASKSESLVK